MRKKCKKREGKETVFYSSVFFSFFKRRFNSGLRQRREGGLWLLGECIQGRGDADCIEIGITGENR